MTVTFILEEEKHYTVGICPISGCDWVLLFPNELVDWLRENIKSDEFNTNEREFRDCLAQDAILTFDNEEDAIAFKLRWL